jgi:hypothetical protein
LVGSLNTIRGRFLRIEYDSHKPVITWEIEFKGTLPALTQHIQQILKQFAYSGAGARVSLTGGGFDVQPTISRMILEPDYYDAEVWTLSLDFETSWHDGYRPDMGKDFEIAVPLAIREGSYV